MQNFDGKDKWLVLSPRIIYDDNIKVNLKRIRCKIVEWVNLTQDGAPVAGQFERLNETTGLMKAGKFLTSPELVECTITLSYEASQIAISF